MWTLVICVNLKLCSLFNFLYLSLLLLYYFNFFSDRLSWLTTSTTATASWGLWLHYNFISTRFGLLGDFHFRLIGCNKAILVEWYWSIVLDRFGSLRWFIWRGNSLWPSAALFTFTLWQCRWLDWRYESDFWWPHLQYLTRVYAFNLKHLCWGIILTPRLCCLLNLNFTFALFDVLNAVKFYDRSWGRHLCL